MSPAASTRWCPTAEQVMILEEMYRGGVRTPNASHIQQITSHLSLYGKIEGKNVFYWFQNHKARDRQKIRKRLLGNNITKHHLLHFDHIMSFPILPCPPPTTAAADHHHHPHFHHFDQLPCCTSSSSSSSSTHHHHLGLPQLPPFVSSPYFPPPHQPRTEETLARMANICTWKGGDGIHSNEMSITNDDNDRVIIREECDYDYNPHYYYNDNCNYDVDDDDDSTRRPLKTLELFPIKDKTSLKTDKQICGQPNLISSIKL